MRISQKNKRFTCGFASIDLEFYTNH